MKKHLLCFISFTLLGALVGISLSGLLIYIDLLELRMSFTWNNIEWVVSGQRLHGVSLIIFPIVFGIFSWLVSFVFVTNIVVRRRERLARGGNIILSMVARDVDIEELLLLILREIEREIGGLKSMFVMNYKQNHKMHAPSIQAKGKVSKGCSKILSNCCKNAMVIYGNIDESKLPPAIIRELQNDNYSEYSYYPLVDAAGKNLGVFAFFGQSKIKLDLEVIAFYSRVAEISLNKYWHREELKWTRALADNTSRIAALGEMYKSVAHEVNNPLAILSLINQSVRKTISGDGVLDRGRILKNCNTVDSTINRLQGIIKGLKRISKRSEKTMSEISIMEIVNESCGLFQEKFKSSGINLEIEYIDIAPHEFVDCRGNEIIQVLVSLLSNAYEAILNMENPWIKLVFEGHGDELLVSVIDCGCGILNENRAIIFNPFFTTKERGERTGLGLAISKRIVEEHTGRIYLDEKSKDTRISFLIPRFSRLVAPSLLRGEVHDSLKNH